MSPLDQTVYVVQGGKLVQTTPRQCENWMDETTTPRGIGPRLHLRGNEVWTWGVGGNNPRMLRQYDTGAEAQAALDAMLADDFWRHHDVVAFSLREDAEDYLRLVEEN